MAIAKRTRGEPERPAKLRAIGRVSLAGPWLAGLFDGVCDPRLQLAGWAVIRHEIEHRDGKDPIRVAWGELLRAGTMWTRESALVRLAAAKVAPAS